MKKTLLFIIFLTITILPIFALSDTILLKTSMDFFNKGKYSQSLEIVKQIISQSPQTSKTQAQAYYIGAKNYFALKDFDNTILFCKKIIQNNKTNNDNEKSNILRDTYKLYLYSVSAKLDSEYKHTKKIDNSTVSDMITTLTSIIEYDKNEASRLFYEYACDILRYDDKESDVAPIIKVKIINMILPYLSDISGRANTMAVTRENYDKYTTTELNFFRIYCTLLTTIMKTENSDFVSAGTTKEKIINVVKTKTSVLRNDYDKDLFEALYYYYTEDIEHSDLMKKLIKKNYDDKYYIKPNYQYTYSFTDYVFQDVDDFVYNSIGKKYGLKRNIKGKVIQNSKNIILQGVGQTLLNF